MEKLFMLLVAVGVTSGEMVDLTHYNDNDTLTYPANKLSFSMTVTLKGWWENNPRIWLQTEELNMVSHSGTHMDAPSHFKKDGLSMDQVPLERFISAAVVVDHSERCKENPNDALLVSDLQAWEEEHGRIPAGAMVLARSGWSKFYNVDNDKYYGMLPDARETFNFETGGLNFPGISKNASEWLVKERNVFGVATETLSIDTGETMKEFPAHVNFAAADILMIENVGTGIHKLPPSGAMVISLPLKNRGASGSPIRMFAYWGDDTAKFNAMTAGASSVRKGSLLLIAGIIAVFRLRFS